jgi:hypothetical protein
VLLSRLQGSRDYGATQRRRLPTWVRKCLTYYFDLNFRTVNRQILVIESTTDTKKITEQMQVSVKLQTAGFKVGKVDSGATYVLTQMSNLGIRAPMKYYEYCQAKNKQFDEKDFDSRRICEVMRFYVHCSVVKNGKTFFIFRPFPRPQTSAKVCSSCVCHLKALGYL